MSQNRAVVLLGHAIVDELTFVAETFLSSLGREKGSMELVSAEASNALRATLRAEKSASGGSAANTAAALAMLGTHSTFVGRVADDELGHAFAKDLQSVGVIFKPSAGSQSASTSSCSVMVTPDGERTMSTFLGASTDLTLDDLDETAIEASAVCYFEGYLWDCPSALAAIERSLAIASSSGTAVALSLSDAGCVLRHREEFLGLLGGRVQIDSALRWSGGSSVSIVFGNEEEFAALVGQADVEDALARLAKTGVLVALTKGAGGSIVFSETSVDRVNAATVEEVIDATGAGDMFAAGFLHGLVHGATSRQCAQLGALAASQVIAQLGGRPKSLAGLPEKVGI